MYFISNPLDFLSLLGTNVFHGCETLDRVSFEGYKKTSCVLPKNITSLGESAFENCISINEVIIDISINTIPAKIFKGCVSLQNIVFNKNSIVTTIGTSAFENCSTINKLSLPVNLSYIGDNSFKDCTNLDNIVFNTNIINITIKPTSFTGCIQFINDDNAVIFTNNTKIKNYFSTKFAKVKQRVLEHVNNFDKYFIEIYNLLNNDYTQTKKIFYPSLDVKLTRPKQLVTIELIPESIAPEIIPLLRNTIVRFIFETNKQYNSFIINNYDLKFTKTILSNDKHNLYTKSVNNTKATTSLNSSYYMNVYNNGALNIDTVNDIQQDKDLLAVYGLLSKSYSEVLVDNYKVRLSLDSNDKYNIVYSSDNFVSSIPLMTGGNNNTTVKLTNYSILTGEYKDYIIYNNTYSDKLEEQIPINNGNEFGTDLPETIEDNITTSRCRSCNSNLAGNDPASQYQKQKLIQNTVRIKSSLYTMNLAGLSSYQKPLNVPQVVEQSGTKYIVPAKVYWNQMSDRASPATGFMYNSTGLRRSVKPGISSPGGIGVDIKHNSYERHLNKLKGKKPLRKGVMPPDYGVPIIFNRAYPVYGGKIVKTGIINDCDCNNSGKDKIIYNNSLNDIQNQILSVTYNFNVGDFVWARKYADESTLYKGVIVKILDGHYTVKFDNMTRVLVYNDLRIYFNCDNCKPQLSIAEELLSNPYNDKEIQTALTTDNNVYCKILNTISVQGGLF